MRRELVAAALSLVMILGCEREARRLDDIDPAARVSPAAGPFRDNAWATGEGARLYNQMNCVGCHANGGGAMGPALMDGAWRYGADPPAVFKSIMDGRPNGMPAFRARISEQQAWQLVAYVRSLSGLLPGDVAPGRGDHMAGGDPTSRRPRLPPSKEPVP
jgi:cytochrome c oxidase cbb3-type subunit 3